MRTDVAFAILRFLLSPLFPRRVFDIPSRELSAAFHVLEAVRS